MPFDANGWSEIIKATFAGLKDLILAFAAVGTIWIQAQNSGKLDVAANKADEVKQALTATTAERQQTLATMQHTDLTTAAMIAAVKAELTKDPDDMDTAKAAKMRVEEHAALQPK